MTKVIKEGNSYEFPSQDIHRTIINKLIMNDSSLFRHLFTHIKQEYAKHEKAIKKKMNYAAALSTQNLNETSDNLSKSSQNLIKFMVVFEQFTRDVEADINKGVQLLNIDYYMRDLKKHALEEYEEVHSIELTLHPKDSTDRPENNHKLNIRYGLV